MFFNARWLDPQLGRFTQADSIVPGGVQGVQAWDRYAYANNNPVHYTDPSGHCITDPLTAAACAIVLSAVGGGLIGASLYMMGQAGAKKDIDFGELALAAGVGAASAVAITAGVITGDPLLVAAGTGAAVGAASNLTANIITGNEFDTSDFIISTAGNALGAIALPFAGIPVNVVTASITGAVVNLDVQLGSNMMNHEDTTSDDVNWAIGTGLVGGGVEGIDGGSEIGKAMRTISSWVISNLPKPQKKVLSR
jgi:hypothetical protein